MNGLDKWYSSLQRSLDISKEANEAVTRGMLDKSPPISVKRNPKGFRAKYLRVLINACGTGDLKTVMNLSSQLNVNDRFTSSFLGMSNALPEVHMATCTCRKDGNG